MLKYFSKKSLRENYFSHFMWNLKNDTNEPIYETEKNRGHREWTDGCQKGGIWGKDGL